MRILVCGGREYDDYNKMFELFHRIISPLEPSTIVEGDADGADKMAGKIAKQFGIPVEEYPVTKEMWDKYGKWEAPKVRNQDMLDTGIDVVFAFPGGPGTLDMKKRADSENVLVLDVW